MRQDGDGMRRRNFLAGSAAAGGAALVAGGAVPAAAAVAGAADETTGAEPVTVVTPADKRYPDLVRGWNQRWVARPEMVCLAETTAQVAQVVQKAVSTGKRLTVRGGGHCWEDWVFNPEVRVILDMTKMNEVYYDPRMNAIAVEAGSQLLNVYERMYRTWGVVVPGGMCFQVGAGGHVSGGGWGLLCRQLGLVVDHLYGVEVVTVAADGTVRTVVATREANDPHRELWWAHTGGGGGNFGVITRFWFRSPGATGTDPAALLPQPPAEVLVSAVAWPWAEMTRERFGRLVRNYGEWHARNLRPGTPNDNLVSMLSLNHRSNGQIGLVTQVDATVPGADKLLADFLAAMTAGLGVKHEPLTAPMGELPAMAEFAEPRRMPWLQSARFLGTTNPTLNDPSLKGDFKSSYYRTAMPETHVDEFYRHLTRTDLNNPTASVMLSSFGGKVNAVAPDATASAHRGAAFKAAWMIWWTDPADEAGCLSWLRQFFHGVYAGTGGVPVPDAVTDGCYVNYPDIDLHDPAYNKSNVPWYTLYYKNNYPRLQRVKAAYDPKNVFRHSQSVRLPNA
ncbi:FAD-binding oxidoreductase [Streptomyces sp. LP05-1]|uniref:FAD-binding oxidoreductase n=1 Tax=Streptomyces pyxinae TaxID=2970734 RepID=A0ABT2CL56_9ACTN|nr:FAD-binding oxidoreductase [Streptomyces sp. LP05-1]MCS0637817.1 FAD-binding oxidoreductase [Streptomyces sp. LP05-1]